jgi:rubrerythrin
LWKVYIETYGEEPRPPQIPPLEVYPILDKFSRAEDVIEGLELAMESELLAKRVYETLAEETDDRELVSIYRTLAGVELGHYDRLMEEFKVLKENLKTAGK